MQTGFTYPTYFFRLIDQLCGFVNSKKKLDPGIYFHSCNNFADFFASVFATQAVLEPSYEDVFDQLKKVYEQFVLPIPYFAIKYSEDLGLNNLSDFMIMIQKAQELERYYCGKFSEFISNFGNSVELIRFIEKYFGIDKLIRVDDMLYLLGLFYSEHGRSRYVIAALTKLRIMRHPYDKETYKFVIETIARKTKAHVNYVALLLNLHVNEWMREARLLKIEDERQNEYTF